ncbi:uncharacterized protein FTOL_09757 [Fusarium torulosum]|uniref:Heterokaryon incompatibility domain-containing protein n=1 Tax=Fusarium torulosum TaxID=33205 RepID=A0AAE8MGS6_9HYPO|nr:uncharacterized protein FTOL_09757 [Fusarium torulosum]
MWLINTHTLALEEFFGPDRPHYVILSHTWGKGEVTFQEFRSGLQSYKSRPGAQKILKTCELARARGFDYVWIDTCCIDKTNSVELAEAINSMFEWYASAAECYVYLQDLAPDAHIHTLKSSRWFSRGWTLQELLAPDDLTFFDQDWHRRGTKHDLAALIDEATGISQQILRDKHLLSQVPVSHKMSWAAYRQTTRPEDIAYCLIGIFDVKMAFIYGEGRKNAFFRLQEEIMRRTNDMSIFAWQSLSVNEKYRGVLASGPEEFVNGSLYQQARTSLDTPEFTMTNKGVRIHSGLEYTDNGDVVLCLHHSKRQEDYGSVGIYLKAYSGGTYARMRPYDLATIARPVEGRPAQRYLSPSISEATERKLETALENAILFNSSLKTTFWQYESTTPTTWWDHDTQLYLRDGNKSFTAFHLFRSDWDNIAAPLRFIVAFGITENNLAWVEIDSRKLYDVAVSGQIHLVEAYRHWYNSSHVATSRQSTPRLISNCAHEGDHEVCKPYLQPIIFTYLLKVSITTALVHGYPTFVINMTAERLSEIDHRFLEFFLQMFLGGLALCLLLIFMR